MKMRLIGSPETSVSNYLTPRKNPEHGRMQDYQPIFKLDEFWHLQSRVNKDVYFSNVICHTSNKTRFLHLFRSFDSNGDATEI